VPAGLVGVTGGEDELAGRLIVGRAIPETEPRDAAHISLATVNGIQYLVTWNFKHIANATTRARIEAICRRAGYEPPIILTHLPVPTAATNACEEPSPAAY
jgi:hypothetical protein